MILCACGCGGKIIVKPFHKYVGIPKYIHGHNTIGRHLSEELKLKIANSNRGKHRSEETKKKMSQNHADVSGKNNPNFGKHGKETSMFGRTGILSPHWRGGKKLWTARMKNKRRNLGFNLINELLSDDDVAHHLTKDYVAYVPEYINKSITHNIHNGKGMDEVNFFTLNYLFLIYNRNQIS